MRSAVETGQSLWTQHRGFAWMPTRIEGRLTWLKPYWIVVQAWGWGAVDEWKFLDEKAADAFFDRRMG